MAELPHPPRGTIITYVDPDTTTTDLFQRAVVTGPGIPDPQTNHVWIPVLRPDRVAVLLDPAQVVDIRPRQLDTMEPIESED
jgi:hypothetical protein